MAKKKVKVVDPKEDPSTLDNKKGALALMIKDLNKKAGYDVAQFGLPEIEYMPTDINYLDQLMGGGLMAGRITTMMGKEMSGKTSLTALMVAAAQRADPKAVWMWLDFENSLYQNSTGTTSTKNKEKSSWLETLGVDTSRLIFIHSLETMEQYCNFCLNALRSETKLISGVVIDSVGAMIPQGVIYKKAGAHLQQKGMEADTVAILARSLGKFLGMSKGLLARHKCPMIAITHVYQDISPMGGYLVPKGGNAFRHFADLRLNLGRGPKVNWPFNEKVNDKPNFLGFEQIITLDKTKNSSSMTPGTQINLPFLYGKGIDESRFLAARAIHDGFITQLGAWYYFEDNLDNTGDPKARSNKLNGMKSFWNHVGSSSTFKQALVDKYKEINLFKETSDQLQINNLDEDQDIIDAS